MDIGKRIRKCRKEKGMTQADLARHLNVNRATVSKYESELIPLLVNTLIKIASALGVSLTELLEEGTGE